MRFRSKLLRLFQESGHLASDEMIIYDSTIKNLNVACCCLQKSSAIQKVLINISFRKSRNPFSKGFLVVEDIKGISLYDLQIRPRLYRR
jgi:hypothetical protein